ncbi:uncharacterized protein LOC110112215 isoform X1 [Dendrobium catenatum]|uniref:Uncharacterized protein n=1 Tax=Dendrobium catenatum TaxID=906689 RepID=A0A2I0W2Z3_9ASPA|nr:uncharacterized protein LOC110112215 isoform X1 [Dendrobium catenatum]PKU70032.1 hypothetical protein MA16_Dca014478 [Dendrobium catenatum]
MALPSSIDQSLILLGVFLLPLNLLSFIYGSLRRTDGREARYFRPAIISAFLISLSTILALSELDPSPLKQPISELNEMKAQVTKLELLLEEKNMLLNSRILEIEKSKKLIEEMDGKIEFLQRTLNDVKVSYGGTSVFDEKIKVMYDEVQQLLDESRRNNFNIHVSESKTWEAEKKVEEVASKVEQMQNIINEQWIQIQQLEQSLQMTKVMASRVNNKARSDGYKKKKSNGCLMSRLRRSMAKHSHSKPVGLPDSFFLGGSISRSSLLKASNQFKGIISAARKKHHELQCTVKRAMKMNDYTAPLAHSELVFFVASTILIFPLMMAWLLCSSVVD